MPVKERAPGSGWAGWGVVRHSGVMRGRPIVLHPLLFAAYPVLFLFAQNAAEQVTLEPLWAPLAVAVGAAAGLLLLLSLALRNAVRAGLFATLTVTLFFSYGHVWNLVGESLGSQWFLIAAWAVLAVVGAIVLWRLNRWAPRANTPLNVLGGVAVALNVAAIGAFVFDSGGALPAPVGRADAALNPESRPDIYYIVPDRYASEETLREIYDFDNSAFYDALEERGFYVARDSYANYIKTPHSLLSTLAMEYLDQEQLQSEATSGEDRGPLHRRLRGELPVPHTLQELGYRHLQVVSWWGPTRDNVDADVVYAYEGASEFTAGLVQTTLLAALDVNAVELDPWDWRVLREHSLYQLDRLERIPELPGPKFVFAHLLIPHDPYVFDIDGSFMDRPQVRAQGEPESYLRQLQYTNQRLLGIVDRIRAAYSSSDDQPIIIIQADEGPFPPAYRADEWGFNWMGATDEELQQKFGILNAVYLPGVDAEAAGFHRGATQVNTFRIIFNEYFGADLPLLPERIYAHPDLRHFLELFEITDRLE
jgi:hypothetical protein